MSKNRTAGGERPKVAHPSKKLPRVAGKKIKPGVHRPHNARQGRRYR